MPTYEYECSKCNKTFDVYQSMKDEPFKVCSKEICKSETWGEGKLRRLLGTGAGIIFKGSGFYSTDYRSSGYADAAKKEATAPSQAVSKSDSSSPKPAPSPASAPAETSKPSKPAV